MDRLTKREGDIVYMVKDGELLAPVALSGQEVRRVLQKLADYEDALELAYCRNMHFIAIPNEAIPPDKPWKSVWSEGVAVCRRR